MRVLQLFLSVLLTAVCFGQNLKPIPGMPFVNRAHRRGRGLVGGWLFNDRPLVTGITHDFTGNNNHGTLLADTHWVPGLYGSALNFDGSGDYVDCGSGSSLQVQSHTLSAWIYDTGGTSVREIFSRMDAFDAGGYQWAIYSNNIYFGYYDGTFRGWYADTTTLPTNKWVHIVGVWNGTHAIYYVNGVFSSTDATETNPISHVAGDIARIGDQPNNSSFQGKIDHILFYNRALDASEITQLHRDHFCMFDNNIRILNRGVAAAPAGGAQVIVTHRSSIASKALWMLVPATLFCFGMAQYKKRKAA